jgi:hypothetical protein
MNKKKCNATSVRISKDVVDEIRDIAVKNNRSIQKQVEWFVKIGMKNSYGKSNPSI